MLWKKCFHGVEKFYGVTGLRGGGRRGDQWVKSWAGWVAGLW